MGTGMVGANVGSSVGITVLGLRVGGSATEGGWAWVGLGGGLAN